MRWTLFMSVDVVLTHVFITYACCMAIRTLLSMIMSFTFTQEQERLQVHKML